jgi:hypothetical protein
MPNIVRTLYHGSAVIIEKPQLGKGKPTNDYGLGFHCTENIELAKEWACTDRSSGHANIYSLDTSKLSILRLSSNHYSILNWLAVLVNNRTFKLSNQIASQARSYVLKNFLPDISTYDAIVGYRADDSYFAFAQDFLNNTISLRKLERAMYLGKLGEQFVLKSEKAFKLIKFEGSEPADREIYFTKKMSRDNEARDIYLNGERHAETSLDDLYILDILRQEMKNNDDRLQRKLFE